MEERSKIQQELKAIAPFLSEQLHKSKPPATNAPKDYFHQLEQQVLEQVLLKKNPIEAPTTNSERFGFFKSLFFRAAVLSFFLMGLVVLPVWWKLNTPSASYTNLDAKQIETELSLEEIETYISTNIEEFELDLFEDFTSESTEVEEVWIEDILHDVDVEELEELL